jgi:hypothetical protein
MPANKEGKSMGIIAIERKKGLATMQLRVKANANMKDRLTEMIVEIIET